MYILFCDTNFTVTSTILDINAFKEFINFKNGIGTITPELLLSVKSLPTGLVIVDRYPNEMYSRLDLNVLEVVIWYFKKHVYKSTKITILNMPHMTTDLFKENTFQQHILNM